MFEGSIVALITPMNDKGLIDRISLKRLINYHIINGTKAIVVVGTTGESSTLSQKEHHNVVMLALEISDNRIPIIAGTGANSTTEAIYLTNSFENSGVSGCLSVTPYYNKPTQEGLYKHFKLIAENTDLLQILYNIPNRTGCDLLPNTISKLSNINNIIGIKEATGDLNRVRKIKKLVSKNFLLFSGDDASALDFIILGGNGVISVTANVAAKEMSNICYLANQGKYNKAKKINEKLSFLHEQLFIETNPIPVKWACKILGLINNDNLRLPMTKLKKRYYIKVKQALMNANLIN
ncbi:MAG: 4-hydroxy-tetrahydrodipicolinate synthase [Enterobacterales bacterium]